MDAILLIALTVMYLAAFIARNLLVKKQIDQPVRAKDILLRMSIVSTTLCFVTAIGSTQDRLYRFAGSIEPLRTSWLEALGFLLFGISIAAGWIISAQLKHSWRVGVLADQKTALVKDGLFAYIRNPYFLSYFVMFAGLWLIRPSLLLAALVLATIAIFHAMVLKEERYLAKVHGQEYQDYKSGTGRYFPRFR